MAIDYKIKYLDIRNKFLEATDTAYRLGMEEGLKMRKQTHQHLDNPMEFSNNTETEISNGDINYGLAEPKELDEGFEENQMGADNPENEAQPDNKGTLDEHIAMLSGLVAKGEKPSVKAMRSAVEKIIEVRKKEHAKNNKRATPVIYSPTTSAQKKFVNSLIDNFDKEKKAASAKITDIIKRYEKGE